MAFSFNKIIVFGNLGKEPEVTVTNSGKEIMKFSLATTNSYKSGEEWKEETTWHNVTLFSPTDFMKNNIRKGTKLLVEGRLTIDKYEDKEGIKRQSAKIIAENICFADTRKGGDYQGEQADTTSGETKDDLPF